MMWQYQEYLPPIKDKQLISIGEGNTPLVKSRYIGPSLGLQNLYFKLENLNPTGSYKDRFASAFVSSLLEKGAGLCIATSSGNTGAALSCLLRGSQCRVLSGHCRWRPLCKGSANPALRRENVYGCGLWKRCRYY